MKQFQNVGSFVVLMLLSYGIIFHFYGNALISPGSYLMEDGSDGLKNYYTLAYYLKHDAGLLFEGLNYPYGEHVVYTDNQPLLAFVLKFVDNNIYPVGDYGIHFVNLFMLISLAFAPFFLWLILKRFGVNQWFAIPFAIVIGFLSPQMLRTFAHYALAYTWYIPMLWYFLIRFQEGSRKWFWGSCAFGAISVFSFIHSYHLLIGTIFTLAFALILLISHIREFKKYRNQIGSLVFIAITPLVLFLVFNKLTDPFTDRIEIPYGFFAYTSKFEGVFMPLHEPFRGLINDFSRIITVNVEAQSSIGLIGLIGLIFTIIRMVFFTIKGKPNRIFKITTNKTLNKFLWASVLVFLYASGVPFVWAKWTLEYIPQLSQFRSLGRFAWVFYYVITIYVAYYFYLLYRRLSINKLKGVGVSIVVFVLLLWGGEAYKNIDRLKDLEPQYGVVRPDRFFSQPPEYLDSLAQFGYQIDDFQAVMMLPYFNVGSEKFSIWGGRESLQQAMSISYHTGIPIMGNFLSRTSIGNSLKSVQMLSSDFIEKEILKDITDQPILLGMYYNGEEKPYEIALIEKAKFLFKTGKMEFYALEKEHLQPNFKMKTMTYNAIKDSLKSGNFQNTIYKSTNTEAIVLNQFETIATETKLRGNGAGFYENKDNVGLEIFNGQLSADTTIKSFEMSVWVYVDYKYSFLPNLYHERWDSNNVLVSKELTKGMNATEVYNGWIKISTTLPNDKPYRHRLFLTDHTPVIADDLLIRPTGVDVYWGETDSSFILNNYTIKKE